MTNLLPCPFCGNQEYVELQNTHSGMMRMHCDNCGGCGYETDNREQAIEFWNRRTVAIPPDVRETLRNALREQMTFFLDPNVSAALAWLDQQEPTHE